MRTVMAAPLPPGIYGYDELTPAHHLWGTAKPRLFELIDTTEGLVWVVEGK